MTTIDPQVEALLKDPAALIPAIVQDVTNNEVLMLAYMNAESLALTLSTGKATYWSRSRNELWVKGATSGHFQDVHSVALDCDGDALLLKVTQTGAACHTGDRTCFHTPLELGQ
ncbi:HisI Phosphoribosyl-AMP cyclohydrolase [Candidatus Nanopelagicaceae bacterium]